MQMEVTMNTVINIGIDVHKDSYSLSAFTFNNRQCFGQTRIASKSSLVIKYVNRMKQEHQDAQVVCGYEAGPTGYGLYRDLEKAGIPCAIMAPTTMPKASGSKVKNDRLDAQDIAKHLAFGTYSSVHVPTAQDESVKNFTRLRNTRKTALKKAKQNLLSFLLRCDRSFNEGKTHWTKIHFTWLKQQKFDNWVDQETFNEYLQEVHDQMEKVARYDQRIEELASMDCYRENVRKLCCFRGIETHTALSLISEIGDFSRFLNARQFSAFLGLVPSEESSGQKERRGAITKAGNTRLRLLLIEGAKSTLRSNIYGKKSKRLLARHKGNPPDVIAYADRANRRLHKSYDRLTAKGVHHNKATVAVAREMACFVWGMMNDRMD